MEWKRDRCGTSQTLRPIVPLYRLFRALARTLGSGGTVITVSARARRGPARGGRAVSHIGFPVYFRGADYGRCLV
ncbi:hypothetical protein EVAR_36871_1 [Eumeta japonica]|uniref:Uncharacterized protein n=1 Tax=Eumeta variegata TaxID=151549 RepID=A0A4C1WRH6_EUMVA|nr:hypothetical protein EVAR_36871_1 [Eumeta japonica]